MRICESTLGNISVPGCMQILTYLTLPCYYFLLIVVKRSLLSAWYSYLILWSFNRVVINSTIILYNTCCFLTKFKSISLIIYGCNYFTCLINVLSSFLASSEGEEFNDDPIQGLLNDTGTAFYICVSFL